MTVTPVLRDQLDTTLAPPPQNKLMSQLRRARDLGYPTILVIDTTGPAATFPHRYMFSDEDIPVISQVVQDAAYGHDVLDICVLVRPDDICVLLYGDWPERASAVRSGSVVA